MDFTCKQLVANQHDTLWDMFWLSIACHVFLGLVVPSIRYFFRFMRNYLKQNLQDHVELGQMVKK